MEFYYIKSHKIHERFSWISKFFWNNTYLQHIFQLLKDTGTRSRLYGRTLQEGKRARRCVTNYTLCCACLTLKMNYIFYKQPDVMWSFLYLMFSGKAYSLAFFLQKRNTNMYEILTFIVTTRLSNNSLYLKRYSIRSFAISVFNTPNKKIEVKFSLSSKLKL